MLYEYKHLQLNFHLQQYFLGSTTLDTHANAGRCEDRGQSQSERNGTDTITGYGLFLQTKCLTF